MCVLLYSAKGPGAHPVSPLLPGTVTTVEREPVLETLLGCATHYLIYLLLTIVYCHVVGAEECSWLLPERLLILTECTAEHSDGKTLTTSHC